MTVWLWHHSNPNPRSKKNRNRNRKLNNKKTKSTSFICLTKMLLETNSEEGYDELEKEILIRMKENDLYMKLEK